MEKLLIIAELETEGTVTVGKVTFTVEETNNGKFTLTQTTPNGVETIVEPQDTYAEVIDEFSCFTSIEDGIREINEN